MAVVFDPVTGLALGDPDADMLHAVAAFRGIDRNRDTAIQYSSTSAEQEHILGTVRDAFDRFILSVSGFRKVCAADGNEESSSSEVTVEDRLLAAFFSLSFVDVIRERRTDAHERQLCIAVGVDARPTGPALADSVIRALIGEGVSVRYLFIVPAPEIMAYVRSDRTVDAFVYISASHNPLGHNGIKFGMNRGGVLEPEHADHLIRSIRAGMDSLEKRWNNLYRTASGIRASAPQLIRRAFDEMPTWKSAADQSYIAFTVQVVTGSDKPDVQTGIMGELRAALEARPIGVLGELNGSARSTGIDGRFLAECGVTVSLLNDTPGRVVHRIVPEGESLEPARVELERLARTDPRYLLGYVPDNDGDRGNLVYYTAAAASARILTAQEVFALSCVSELAWLVYTGEVSYDERGKARQKVAIAVNGPTSLRIDRIAEAFDAHVFRAEVGEANVVELSRRLRKRGYIVRILGEGSNGGNITYPAAVRDPLNTVFAMLKLLALRSTHDRPGLFEIWCSRIGRTVDTGERHDLGTVLSTLPAFQTTNAFDPRALLNIRAKNHGLLKAEYERLFAAEWHEKRSGLSRRLRIHTWKEINYDGVEEKQGVGKAFRSPPERGGFKIVFKDEKGHVSAFIWMRGSGTEPVFRVMADVESDRPEDEQFLLAWHVDMVRRADAAAAATEASAVQPAAR